MITFGPTLNHTINRRQTLREVSVDVYDRDQFPGRDLLAALHPVHPNLLIVGSNVDAERTLASLRPMLRAPVVSWWPNEVPHLPVLSFRTLIVREIDGLTATQQGMLSALVADAGHGIQVVSVSSRPLFPLVSSGRFLDALYYRLNSVLLESRKDVW